MSVYDPCSGSGGMLILSKDYVEEHGGNPRNLRSGGPGVQRQRLVDLEDEPATARHPRRRHAERRHPRRAACTSDGGQLDRFDRVLSNPPFSLNYTRDGMQLPERFQWGWAPEGGKKADLMFVQHMVSVLKRPTASRRP